MGNSSDRISGDPLYDVYLICPDDQLFPEPLLGASQIFLSYWNR